MKFKMMIGVMVAVLLLMDNQPNIAKKSNISSHGLIVEAIVKYYPNASVEEAEVLLKSEINPDGYGAENLGAGQKMEPDAAREKYIINIEHF